MLRCRQLVGTSGNKKPYQSPPRDIAGIIPAMPRGGGFLRFHQGLPEYPEVRHQFAQARSRLPHVPCFPADILDRARSLAYALDDAADLLG